MKPMKDLGLKGMWESLSKTMKGVVIWIILTVIAVILSKTVLYVDPYNCAKIAQKRNLGVSYDSGEWERCKDKYYGVSTMNIECAKGN